MNPPKYITEPVLKRIIHALHPFCGLPCTPEYFCYVRDVVIGTLFQAAVEGLIQRPPGGFATKVSLTLEEEGHLLVDFAPELKGYP